LNPSFLIVGEKIMETFGKMILGAFVGAIANTILFYCYLELPETHSGVNWGAGIVTVIFGIIIGVIIGVIIGLIQPRIKNALIVAIIIFLFLVAFDAYSFIPSTVFQQYVEQRNYYPIVAEAIVITLFSLGLVAEILLITKIVSLGKKKL
jgi:hypothetical protein